MNFNTEAAYKAYFEAIATSHNDIDAFMFGDEYVITTGQPSNMSEGVTMWLDYYRPITIAGSTENCNGNNNTDSTTMQPTSDRKETTSEQQAVYKSCEDIVQQIFAKIAMDFQTEVLDNEAQWSAGQFGRMQESMFAGTMYRGAAAELAFHYALNMEYDNTKWS